MCSLGSNLQNISISSDDGLALSRRQTIIWNSVDIVHRRIYVDIVHRRIYASLGLSEF